MLQIQKHEVAESGGAPATCPCSAHLHRENKNELGLAWRQNARERKSVGEVNLSKETGCSKNSERKVRNCQMLSLFPVKS